MKIYYPSTSWIQRNMIPYSQPERSTSEKDFKFQRNATLILFGRDWTLEDCQRSGVSFVMS
jgi:hypothetical protein